MKYRESHLPPNIIVRVWHNRNPAGLTRWTTRCCLYFKDDTEFKNCLVEEFSHCHPNDQPNRKIGRAIAVGRALKFYDQGMAALSAL